MLWTFICAVRKSNFFFLLGAVIFFLGIGNFFMGFPCSLLSAHSSFTEAIECSTYLGCRFSFIPGCRVFCLTACAVVFERRNQAYELEGCRSIVSGSSLKSTYGCIFLRKKAACLSKINWIYRYAFHLQQLKTSGWVWGCILWMDHRLLVNCLQETLAACLTDHLWMQGANTHVNLSSQKVGMVNECSISVAQKRIKRVASKRK